MLSNTAPLAAYRSAGRRQVMFVMERLIDLAGRRHGFDRAELRRRNLIPAAAMPYTNPYGIVYDSGERHEGDGVGADIARVEAPERQEAAVRVESQLHRGDEVARAHRRFRSSQHLREIGLVPHHAPEPREVPFFSVPFKGSISEPEKKDLGTVVFQRKQVAVARVHQGGA